MDSTLSQIAGRSVPSANATVSDSRVVVPVRIANPRNAANCYQPLSFGVPCRQGELPQNVAASLVNAAGRRYPTQLSVLSYWPDNSSKWILVEALPDEISAHETEWTIDFSSPAKAPAPRVEITRRAGAIDIHTGARQFTIESHGRTCRLQCRSHTGEELGAAMLRLATPAGRELAIRWQPSAAVHAGDLRTTICLSGQPVGQRHIYVEARYSFYAGQSLVRSELTLHNARAAQHVGGLWDLGDKASWYFGEFALSIASSAAYTGAQMQIDEESALDVPLAGGALVQHSSGGRNWRSHNHVNRHGNVPLTQWGYDWQVGGCSLRNGNRASPVVVRHDSACQLSVAMPEFWQQFPKSLAIKPQSITCGIFPSEVQQEFELQPGERKRHEVWLRWDEPGAAADLNWVHSPASVMATTDWHAQSGCWPCLLPAQQDPDDRLASVTTQAVAGPHSFFVKREAIDEYGWRNFGEVWADHEGAFYRGNAPVISHYNNQFDLLWGCLLQWVRTQDDAWFALADPLARHVVDIDIYHTQQDKAAYAGGLFWHTDHYLSADTATHRTYAKRNATATAYGGGPSSEHNYATGLLYYHYLTGSQAARDAVLGLADWVIRMDDGAMAPWAWLDAGPTGYASRTRDEDYHGPGRGAGNSLNVLLDAWELTREPRYLAFAETLVRRCIHPADNPTSMQFQDVERRWSYPLFLLALHRFIVVKWQEAQCDDVYAHAQQSLLSYGRWMLANEQLYLDRAEQLQFVTETWAAQDLRKANALRLTALHAEPTLAQELCSKADEIADAAWDALLTFPSHHVTRAIAITTVEGTRDFHLRVAAPASLPTVSPTVRFEPSNFVPARARIKQHLRSPGGWLALLRNAWQYWLRRQSP